MNKIAANDSNVRIPLIPPTPPPLPTDAPIDLDAIVHSGAPPVSPPKSRWREPTSGRSAAPELCTFVLSDLEESEASRGRKKESAGWVSSLVLHGIVLLVITFLLAPADYGGIDAIEIYMSLTEQHEDELLEIAGLEIDTTEADAALMQNEALASLLVEEEEELEPPTFQPQSMISANAADSSEGDSTGKAGDPQGGSGGPRGSFFGIEAYGHKFVYVVDMSGSMEGRRFKRATAELVRSVGDLNENQNFYVLLFSDGATRMFGQSSGPPKALPATHENKERLSQWLRKSRAHGGTDPRTAIHIALKMDPSAIFMLSDGEFKEKKRNVRSSLFKGTQDTYSIVAAAQTESPIHAIAFEDKKSCENMQRIAKMTDGEYRFTEAVRDTEAANESMSFAMAALNRGDRSTATLLMQEIASSASHTSAGSKARTELGKMLYETGKSQLEDENLADARQTIGELAELDPTASDTETLQRKLLQGFLELVSSTDDQNQQGMFFLSKMISNYPKSKAITGIIEPVASNMAQEATKLREAGDAIGALAKLDLVLRRFPKSEAAKLCDEQRQEIVDAVMARARELRESGDAVASAKHLQQLIRSFGASTVGQQAREELHALGSELLSMARDANVAHDRDRSEKIHTMIRDAFGGERSLQSMRSEFMRREREARNMLREAERFAQLRGRGAAMEKFRIIVRKYPSTLAAKQLRSMLGDSDQKQTLQLEIDSNSNPRTAKPLEPEPFVGENAIMLDSLVQ